MIDEWFDGVVDRLCVVVPEYVKPRMLRFMNSSLGWRIGLYASTLARNVAGVFHHVGSEDGISALVQDRPAETVSAVRQAGSMLRQALARMDAHSERARFGFAFYLLALSALAAISAGGGAAACAAAICLYFLAESMEQDYEPVCARVRQRYMAAMGLRAAGMGVMLLRYFKEYIEYGVPTNIVLQSAMIVTLLIHALLYLVLTAFYKRQPLMLRALAGVLGVIPALALAAAVAVAASSMGAPPVQMIGGVLAAAGAACMFFSEQIRTFTQIGSIRLEYKKLWHSFFQNIGLCLMLCGAWLAAG